MRRTIQPTRRVHVASQKEGRECFQKDAKQSCLNLAGKSWGAIKWKGWRHASHTKKIKPPETTYVQAERYEVGNESESQINPG